MYKPFLDYFGLGVKTTAYGLILFAGLAQQIAVADEDIPVAFSQIVEPLPVNVEPQELGNQSQSQIWPSLVSASLLEHDYATELSMSFSAPIPDIPTLLSSEFEGNIIHTDFPVDMRYLNRLHVDTSSRLINLETAYDDQISRLVLTLKDAFEVSTHAQGNSLSIKIAGPAPQTNTSIDLIPGTSYSKGMSGLLDSDSATRALPNITLTRWNAYQSEDGHDVIELEFDRPDVQMSTQELGQQELRFLFKQVVWPALQAKEQKLPDGGWYTQASLTEMERNLALRLKLPNSVYQISQEGNVVRLKFREKARLIHSASLVKDVSYQIAGGLNQTQRDLTIATPNVYTGEPISINFKDTEIRSVMAVFADFTDLNMVLTESVQGKVTMSLDNVPWDQAFDVLLQARDLVARRSGNVMLVSTSSEASKLAEQSPKVVVDDSLEPLVRKVYVVRYQKVDYLLGLIKAEGVDYLSPRGSALADERTGKLIIEDTPTRHSKIAQFIDELDRAIPQVLIEAKVVLVDMNVSKELGVSLNMAGQEINGEITDAADGLVDRGSNVEINTPNGPNATFGYTILDVSGTQFLRARLRALEEDSQVKTISNPRVVTSDKNEALIEQGTRIPYQAATSSGATETQFQDANLKLQVTPQIGPDGSIMLSVDVSKDSVGEETDNGLAINTRHVRTNVSVLNGGTVVLGGVFEDEKLESVTKVPLLGDLPVLGHLFKSTKTTNRERELLIFITPVILGKS